MLEYQVVFLGRSPRSVWVMSSVNIVSLWDQHHIGPVLTTDAVWGWARLNNLGPVFLFFYFFYLTTVLPQWDFSHGKFGLPSPGKGSLWDPHHIGPVVTTDVVWGWARLNDLGPVFFFVFFYNCIVPVGFLPWEIRVAFPGESQLQQSRAIQPRVHAGCFSVSIIFRTLAWTTGSLTCAQM